MKAIDSDTRAQVLQLAMKALDIISKTLDILAAEEPVENMPVEEPEENMPAEEFEANMPVEEPEGNVAEEPEEWPTAEKVERCIAADGLYESIGQEEQPAVFRSMQHAGPVGVDRHAACAQFLRKPANAPPQTTTFFKKHKFSCIYYRKRLLLQKKWMNGRENCLKL